MTMKYEMATEMHVRVLGAEIVSFKLIYMSGSIHTPVAITSTPTKLMETLSNLHVHVRNPSYHPVTIDR